MEAMSELLRAAACWPAWLVLGGPLGATPASPTAAPRLFSSLLHPACSQTPLVSLKHNIQRQSSVTLHAVTFVEYVSSTSQQGPQADALQPNGKCGGCLLIKRH